MHIKINKDICRTCLKNLIDKTDGINIFYEESLLEKFKDVTKLTVELNDGLTETICLNCLNKLNTAFYFIKLAKTSDLHLKSYLEKLNNQFHFVSQKSIPSITPVPMPVEFGSDELNLFKNEGLEIDSNTLINETNELLDEIKVDEQLPGSLTSDITDLLTEEDKKNENFQTDALQKCISNLNDDSPFTLDYNFKSQSNIIKDQEEDCHSLDSLDKFIQLPASKKIKLKKRLHELNKKIKSGITNDTQGSFECPVCHRNYNTEVYLKKHMKLHVIDASRLRCKICKKFFLTNDKLQKHFAEFDHANPFQCEICLEKFAQRRLLSLHARKHLSENLFQCDKCEMKFTVMDELKSHFKSAHKIIREKIYECSFCEMKYARDNLLEQHIKIVHEKPVTCSICGDNVSAKLMKKHLESHSKLNAIFECGQCENLFSKEEELVEHFKTHDCPFQCDFCDEAFDKPINLNQHLLTNHKIRVSETDALDLWVCDGCNIPFDSEKSLLDHHKLKHEMMETP